VKDEIIARTIIPAQSGWLVAVFCWVFKDNNTGIEYPPSIEFEPIIAWDITIEVGPFAPGVSKDPDDHWTDRKATPIIVSRGDPGSIENPWAIVRPDGRYVIDGESYDNEEAAMRHFLGEDSGPTNISFKDESVLT